MRSIAILALTACCLFAGAAVAQDRMPPIAADKLTEAQKTAIAEARSVYEARVAERQILHRQKRLTTFDPEAVDTMEQEYRRDLERFATDRDAKIKKIRADSEGA